MPEAKFNTNMFSEVLHRNLSVTCLIKLKSWKETTCTCLAPLSHKIMHFESEIDYFITVSLYLFESVIDYFITVSLYLLYTYATIYFQRVIMLTNCFTNYIVVCNEINFITTYFIVSCLVFSNQICCYCCCFSSVLC